MSFPYSSLSTLLYNFYQIGDVNGDGYDDACIIKRESNHNIKKNNATPYTITIFRGSVNGLTKDTLLYHSFDNWKAPAPSDNISGNVTSFSLGDFDGNGISDVLIKNEEEFEINIQYPKVLFIKEDLMYIPNIKIPQTTIYKQIFFMGANPPHTDSMGYEAFTDFIHLNRLVLVNIRGP